MSALKEKILNKQNGLLFYSFVPPKITTEVERLYVIAEKQIARISQLDVDGLILYDIQDESERTSEKRTFPYIHTIAPEFYRRTYLSAIRKPTIIYKSIANHTREMFIDWLRENNDIETVVFVGASSRQQVLRTGFSLTDAYQLRREQYGDLLLGGVTIPERHALNGSEHKRILEKEHQGCSFFVTQCVYNINDTKNLLSDYYYEAAINQVELNPFILTLSPCGSLKTLEFMKWLGIEVPKWLYNDLKHAGDILGTSIDMCASIAEELIDFARSKQIPIGFNIESISNKKEEIDAAILLLNRVSLLLSR